MKNKTCIECGSDKRPWFSKKRCKPCAMKSYAKKAFGNSKVALVIATIPKKISDRGLAMMKKDKAFYKKIWDSQPHVCEECGQWLGNELNAGFISHILSKGSCPEHRHDPRNVQTLCLPCHNWWETGKREKMKTYASNQAVMTMLKQEYSQNK